MNKNTNTCNNCGKLGHMYHQCKLPITSYGIIVFRSSEDGLQFLMIRRKDSFGYNDFVRGKYSPYNIYQLQNIVNEMSVKEKERILTLPFSTLWNEMWGETNNNQFKNEEQTSCKKFDTIKEGVVVNSDAIKLEDLVKKSNTEWTETEWEFPKGRRNHKEKDLECALREFVEVIVRELVVDGTGVELYSELLVDEDDFDTSLDLLLSTEESESIIIFFFFDIADILLYIMNIIYILLILY